jgi:cyclic pyranopterin phosphate synthase
MNVFRKLEDEMKKLSHTNESGKARMVDVSAKNDQKRKAKAVGFIRLQPDTLKLIRENDIKKGDVLNVARVGGIMGAKKTSELIPMAHNLPLNHVSVEIDLKTDGVQVYAQAATTGKTGVEMEALTAVSIALLNIYDMCKAVDDAMEIGEIRLIEKTKTNL